MSKQTETTLVPTPAKRAPIPAPRRNIPSQLKEQEPPMPEPRQPPTVYPPQLTDPQFQDVPYPQSRSSRESQQSQTASALLNRVRTLEREGQEQTTEQGANKRQTYMRAIKVLAVLCLVLVVAGGVLLGIGEKEDIDDIDDPEEALFLVGAILLGVGAALLILVAVCGCVIRRRTRKHGHQGTTYAPNPLYDRDTSSATIGAPLFTSPTSRPSSSASSYSDGSDDISYRTQTLPEAQGAGMLSMISEDDEPPEYEETDPRTSQTFSKLMADTPPPNNQAATANLYSDIK